MSALPPAPVPAPSCEDPFDALMPVERARARLLDALRPLEGEEIVGLAGATGRVTARAVDSPLDVPPEANSAMDGYAIRAADIPAEGVARLRVIGTAWAGRPHTGGPVGSGEAVRAFTGAPVPDGADTVVIQERVGGVGEAVVTIDPSAEPRRNVRPAGEDVARGERVFGPGRTLGAADLGVLASLGIARLAVRPRPRVAYFTTGDELASLDEALAAGTGPERAGGAGGEGAGGGEGVAGDPPPPPTLPPGRLWDSNRHVLGALLDRLAVEPIDLGVVPDDPDATREALREAASRADLAISSGGVSAGDADHVARVFHEIGEVAFWRIAMRPGRPLVSGRVGRCAFLGLPGNPVAVMVTFLQFVRPAIARLAGAADLEPFEAPARCLSPLRKSLGRTEYQRGVARLDESGELVVESTGRQGAGRLSSMSAANCLIVVGPEIASVSPGDRVRVQPFAGLLP